MKQSQNNEENLFSTRDLTLASVLVTLKFPVVNIDYQVEGLKTTPVGYFVFENTPQLIDARKKYTQSLLSVEPKLLVTNIRSLKAEITNYFKNPNNRTF